MKKENKRLIALIIIIIAAISVISNKATVPYNEVRQDIERRVNDDGNSIIDLNIKKNLNKYNYECFLCSVKYENNYAKEKYLLAVYKKSLFDRYLDIISELDNYYVGRLNENDKKSKNIYSVWT